MNNKELLVKEGDYSLRVYTNLESSKQDWEYLETKNPQISPFQYYNYNKAIQKSSLFYLIREISTPRIFVVYKKDKPIVIFPLCKIYGFNKKGDGVEYRMYGNRQNGILDVLYDKSVSNDEFRLSVQLLSKVIPAPMMSRIKEDSIIYKSFPNLELLPADNGVTIKLPEEGYDFYFSSLSKNVRQNVRTAYNRMSKDGHSYELRTIQPKDLTPKTKKELLDVYLQRSVSRYGKKFNFTSRYQYKYIHHYTITLDTLENAIYYVLYIDDKIAAFMGCFVNHSNSYLIVPRLAINEEFRRYSPGMLLLNETAKHCYENSGIREIDLSRGVDQYKVNMGGLIYYNHDFILK